MLIRDRGGRCLLLKRSMSSKANAGKWDLPRGKVELGERFEETVLREVAEETGLTISLEHVAGSAEYELPKVKVAYLIMEGRLESGQVRLSQEHDEYAWVDTRELARMDLCDQFRLFVQTYSRSEA